MIDNTPHQTKAYLAGVNLNDPNFDYYMTELANLAEADNMEVVGQSRQNAEKVVTGTYLGLGKINEIKEMARGLKAKILILNDELSPVQIRNLENLTKLQVIDRTELILEIFSNRARTKQAKLQVQLARLQYELPRLHPSQNNLDQQRGGGFANRGAGESKLELNRRTLGKQISAIKQELKAISEQEEIKAKRRNQNHIPKVALVGYTNAGKSTTMNGLLKKFSQENHDKQVFAKNMLFATLDTSVRRIELNNNFSFILSDTVGFISKLPHKLVESFKATLQEVKDADLLINVVDAADPNMIQMIRTTQDVLTEIGVKDTPMITAYNKADKANRNYPQIEGNNILYSAIDTASITTLAKLITKRVFADYQKVDLLLPLSAGKTLAQLHEDTQIISETYQSDGVHLTVRMSSQKQNQFTQYVV
ncbi:MULTISPECIES: GTPase HflX [unclassified Lactobacillus]|uniref:GTPase HflX n=1 Tax=unclassified Lactobacillus TaxID=2620435 RepID=UPI000EFABAFE|nr:MULTISPECIES: GTPase HflX [unclassified Lactobacillus]RMC23693.1 GTPase HflX [Lactobacillus sp. ESL0247]RMC27453.1 GTPase HflX [Lactobacillus sp. ESL0246]RMC30654.1 GTPase HflX [Lactobacillus sp. ESL0245]RMC47233.1 GTPase HflX [Lactobacillus sp. ESL0228]